MKIAIFGATGTIGRRVTLEALERWHSVTAVSHDPARLDLRHKGLTTAKGDVLDPPSIAAAVAGHDAVISAVGPGPAGEPQMVVAAAKALIEGLQRSGVRRLLVVGGAGSLEVRPGVQLVDTPDFPAAWKPVALAHRDALAVYRTAEALDWTYVSPAALIEPGTRTGRYRTGTDQLLVDDKGMSHISVEDFAVALLDEIEKPRFVRRRLTVAY